jgi:hypothetical protein
MPRQGSSACPGSLALAVFGLSSAEGQRAARHRSGLHHRGIRRRRRRRWGGNVGRRRRVEPRGVVWVSRQGRRHRRRRARIDLVHRHGMPAIERRWGSERGRGVGVARVGWWQELVRGQIAWRVRVWVPTPFVLWWYVWWLSPLVRLDGTSGACNKAAYENQSPPLD